MDVDLTQPMRGTGSRHPLIVMLHGFGGDKHDWESTTDEGDGADKYRWNNRWLAKHGYYVLTYTARGFTDDGPSEENNQPPTPYDPDGSRSLPRGTLHLKSRDYEIRDTQWLAALVAATYRDVDPNRIAVTGGSYGGIESWLQASQPTWTFPHSLDRSLPILNLQVAVAKYPSTDLAYALGPNGHGGGSALNDLYESSQGRPNDDQGDGNPIGVPKESYVTGLFALGETKGVFEKGSSTDAPFPCTYGDCEGPINIESWKVRTDAGDPTAPEDPIIRQIRRGLTEFRGAYYQDEGWSQQRNGRKVAVLSIQGWTDDLFPAVESFRIFKYLKRLDPRWPVQVALADVGHSRAQNKPDTWQRLNAQAFEWLESHIDRSHEQRTTVSSEATVCGDGGDPGRAVGSTPEGLATGVLRIGYPGGETTNYTRRAGPERARHRRHRRADRPAGRGVPPVRGADSARRRIHGLLGAAPERPELRRRRPCDRSLHVGGRRERHAPRAPVRRGAGRDRVAHDPGHLPPRERAAHRCDQGSVLRQPLARRSGAQDPPRPDAGR